MTGLIILLVLIPVVIIILLVGIHTKTSSQQELLESLNEKFKQLNDRLVELSKKIPVTDTNVPDKPKETVVKKEVSPYVIERIQVPELPKISIKKESEQKPATEIKQEELAALEENAMPFIETQKETRSDLEKYIGENLANKIGIAVLVLGISFFIKYAIDKNWVHEGGRVIIGLVCGAILIGLAHRIRNKYRAFSSVLVGGGLSVFYFSIAFAFHQYHLISQQTAFLCMVIIAGFGVVLSLLYDRLELSVLATIGGFITPFLVSTGEYNYIALFTYLAILNSGLMVLAWFKRWPAINFIALFFTIIIYGGWLIDGNWYRYNQALPYKPAFLFATIFYLQFVTMNIIHNLRMKRTFKSLDFIVLLSVNFLYYAAGMVILDAVDKTKYQGLFTALLAVFNFLLFISFSKKKSIDKNFIFLLTGLTLTFISLFAPVQLHANYITLFWAAEMVVLFWLFSRSGLKLLKLASLVLAGLTKISLLTNWITVYLSGESIIPVIINKGFITSLAIAIALFIYQGLIYREANSYYIANITNVFARNSFLAASIAVLYLAGILEILYQFSSRFELPLQIIYLQLYTFLFTIALLRIYGKSRQAVLLRFALTIFCFVLYIISTGDMFELSFTLSAHKNLGPHFLGHWLSASLLLIMLYELIQLFKNNNSSWTTYQAHFTWLSVASVILILSMEAYHILIWTNYGDRENWEYAENLFYKAGLTILWSVCSFIMMWLGMKYHFRDLRIISLTLFTIILVKLFTYDIRNIPPGGKIAAFISLGILLLVISFMYQRLKKIIIDDPEEKKNLVS